MIDYNKFAKEAYEVSVSKGWHDARDLEDPDTRASMYALIHSEISEALECIRNGELTTTYAKSGKPEGLPSELADVFIRVCDFTHCFGVSPQKIKLRGLVKPIPAMKAAAAIAAMHKDVSDALDTQEEEWEHLGWLISRCYQLAEAYDVDLDSAILEKHAFNKTRPRLHGGKAI